MSQKRSKNRFMQDIGCKPLCAAMILCSWLILSPTTAKAADDVAITQAVDQQSTVKGTVVDINGEPVIGASVKVDGGTTGTITDLDGNFSLLVPAGAKLVISCGISDAGYNSKTRYSIEGCVERGCRVVG